MSRLTTLLHETREATSALAIGAGEPDRDFGIFRRDVGRLCARLQGAPEGGWLLFGDDAYAFAVGLFALWHTGRHALLAPNHQPQTLESLAEGAAGVLTDAAPWCRPGRAISLLESGAETPPPALRFAPLERDALAVSLYTSGTTGAAKPVAKQLRHLDDEVAELASCWDAQLGSAAVLSTASHEHLYGLLFAVLWPLASGRPFHREHFLHLGEILPQMRATPHCVLASVPTTLRRLARHGRASELRDRCPVVFSSGGPLALDTAHEVEERVGHAPIEVLGSTETGGIAWRQQRVGRPPADWRPLPSVCVLRDEESGVLRVRSPFVSVAGEAGGFSTGDRVALREGGRFSLQGRADQVVKVGEKRLDLDEMTERLRSHAAVDDLALVTLERDGESRVAAVVVPSAVGAALIEKEGASLCRRALRAQLADSFDPVLHPRFWRFVSELPASTQGKVSRRALRSLFAPSETEVPVADCPEVLEEIRGARFVERVCRVPLDLACFPGHFPGQPVVPGVMQLDWAMELAALLLGTAPRAVAIETMKLLSPLTPGQTFRIRSCLRTSSSVEFELWNEDRVYASGRIRLDAEGAARS